MGRQVARHPLARVREQAETELTNARALVERAKSALDAAVRQELIARGKLDGVMAAEAALGDQ